MRIDLTNTTYHARVERANRMVQVSKLEIGIPVATIEEYNKKGNKTIVTLTDTGVVVILDPKTNTIITLFLASVDRAAAIYKEAYGTRRRLPDQLYNQIKINKITFNLE